MAEVFLKDLLLITKDGEWGKGDPADGLSEMTVIRGADFSDVRLGRLNEAPTRYIPTHIAERKKLQPTDILIETAGGTRDQPTGRTVFLKPRLFETHRRPLTCASFSRFLRVNPALAHPEFVYWYLQSLYAAGEMEQHQIQHTGVARFQYTKFAEMIRVPIPPLSEQRAIASVLGALDDKIELNRRMNETLEALAQSLFKSWFVDATQSALPKGWRETTIDELAAISGGKQLPTEECKPSGKFTVFGANGIMGYADRATHEEFVIAFGRVGAYCGSIHWSYDGAWINNNASSVVPHRWPEFVLQAMLNVDFAAMRTGSAQPFIPNSSLSAAKTVRPPDDILDSYCSIVRPLRLKQTQNEAESRTLAALRDALLPKLLSGELRVPAAQENK